MKRRLVINEKMETKKKNILIVDDDPNVLDLLKSGLEIMGYNVTACESAAEFERTLKSFRPDLILMDVSMPGEDGISLCRNIKTAKETADIPVIMLTAFSDERTFHDAMLFGANGFLSKPFDMPEVKKKIEELVSKTNVKKENVK